jgi:hypothetical protein
MITVADILNRITVNADELGQASLVFDDSRGIIFMRTGYGQTFAIKITETTRERRLGVIIDPDTLIIGVKFDTPFENDCIVIRPPDKSGNLLGRDSDGIKCEFHVSMVEWVHRT